MFIVIAIQLPQIVTLEGLNGELLLTVIQRIALTYLVVALMEIFTKRARPEDQLPVRFSIFRLYYLQW